VVVRDVFSRVMAGLQAWPPGLDHRRPFLTRTLARGVYLQLPIPVSEMRSGPPGYVPTSAQDWGQVLMFQGQTCSLFRSFTANGTSVNGEQLEELVPYLLQDGDQVEIGAHLLVFHAQKSTAGSL
jgi:hypothetical protein